MKKLLSINIIKKEYRVKHLKEVITDVLEDIDYSLTNEEAQRLAAIKERRRNENNS